MAEPVVVRVEVPLEGYDPEGRAINAIVYLLETTAFHPMFPGCEGKLSPESKARIASYLHDRYSLGERAE